MLTTSFCDVILSCIVVLTCWLVDLLFMLLAINRPVM